MKTKAVATSLCVILLASCTTIYKEHVGAVDPAGIYVLVMIDGAQVPTTARHGNHEIEIQSGTFTMNNEGMIFKYQRKPQVY